MWKRKGPGQAGRKEAGATGEGPSAGKPGCEQEQRRERDITGCGHKAAEEMGHGSKANLTQGVRSEARGVGSCKLKYRKPT